MWPRAVAAGGVVELAGVLLRVFDEILDRLDAVFCENSGVTTRTLGTWAMSVTALKSFFAS